MKWIALMPGNIRQSTKPVVKLAVSQCLESRVFECEHEHELLNDEQ